MYKKLAQIKVIGFVRYFVDTKKVMILEVTANHTKKGMSHPRSLR